jgi:ubiquitin-conjugating enzyme E2 B
MATFAQRRLVQDLQKIRKNNDEGIIATPNSDDIFTWQAYILGPVDTIW